MKRIKYILAIVLVIVLSLSFSSCDKSLKTRKYEKVLDFSLNVEEGRPIRILQLTDTQIIDSAQRRYDDRLYPVSIENWKIENIDRLLFRYMDFAVEATNPDLIVLTGDNVYGEFDDKGTSLKILIDKMESYNTPWTLVYGNHDNECFLGARWQNSQYIEAKNCLFTRGIDDAEGNGNFTIGIFQGDELKKVLFMLDSHGCVNSDRVEKVISSSGIFEGQIEWFTSVSEELKEINGGENVSSFAFFHHPLKALGKGLQLYGYTSIQNDFYDKDGNLQKFSQVNIGDINARGDWGYYREDCFFIDSDYKVFNIFKENGVDGCFFGHYHNNGCSVIHEGVRLTFGVKTGEYDSHPKNYLGGTLIEIDGEKFTVSPKYYVEK